MHILNLVSVVQGTSDTDWHRLSSWTVQAQRTVCLQICQAWHCALGLQMKREWPPVIHNASNVGSWVAPLAFCRQLLI